MTNPADIARALSERQQQLLIDASTLFDINQKRPRIQLGRYFRSARRVPTATYRALADLGLIEHSWPPYLEPMGLAVRDHLLHRPTANDASTDRTPATVDGCGKEIE